MKLFVWEHVSALTERYHDGGGVTIIAESLEAARKMYMEDGGLQGCDLMTEQPDLECEVSATEPKLFVFPNAGCC
jgi:hypothetical protein